jgi:hypothetical protein
MRRSRWGLARLCSGLICVITFHSAAVAADRSTLPALTSSGSEALTASERAAIVEWTMAQPEVRAKTDGHRHRVLRTAAEQTKTPRGDARRAVLYVRDYDAGVVHEVRIDLGSAQIEIRDLPHAAASPSAEEIEEAMTLVRSDAAFAEQSANPALSLSGGFQWTGHGAADACARDFCVQLAFMEQNFEKKPVHFIIVDLSRQEIVNRDLLKDADHRREGD